MYCSNSPYALFGLAFDAITLTQTKSLIRHAIDSKEQLIIATPNVNFIALANKNKSFHHSILACDLSIVDGTPLFWLLKLLGTPIKEKVPGSTLVESLIADTIQPPIKVFFFGGQDDAAQRAANTLNKTQGGITAVGSYNPGFGSIESMSHPDIIHRINESGADFLIVSLGAQKGHQWIEHNKHKLKTPVISHLGAVVNFVAGIQQRSPKLLQRLGLEWLWRIYQEPALYRRYLGDAITLLKLTLLHYCPALISKVFHTLQHREPGRFTITSSGSQISASLTGNMYGPCVQDFLQSLQQVNIKQGDTVHLDMSQTSFVDNQFAGAMLRLQGICEQKMASINITHINPTVKKMLQHFMVEIRSGEHKGQAGLP